MSEVRGNESTFEAATVQRLRMLGYDYVCGPDLDRDLSEVVLRHVLRDNLAARYPDLTAVDLAVAIDRITRPDGAETLHRNKDFHTEILSRGFDLGVEGRTLSADVRVGGAPLVTGPVEREVVHIHPVDWEHPERNRFHVVNQFRIAGPDRIPDVIVFVNGLPLVVFELKNPWDESANVDDAHNQLRHYGALCPRLFEFNAFCVASDGVETLHGMWTAGMEWYAPWKSVDGSTIESA